MSITDEDLERFVKYYIESIATTDLQGFVTLNKFLSVETRVHI